MLRASQCAMAALLIVMVGNVNAADAERKDDQGEHHMQATITKVDPQKSTVSVKMTDKKGKEAEKTLQLAKDAKYLDADGKEAKPASFKAGDDVCLIQKDEKVTELRKHAEARITKVDEKAGTITVKMTDRNGKSIEKTFRLVEDSEYVDSTGRVAVLDIFQSGDDILFVEADGEIKGMKKADSQTTTGAKENAEKDNDNKKSGGK